MNVSASKNVIIRINKLYSFETNNCSYISVPDNDRTNRRNIQTDNL